MAKLSPTRAQQSYTPARYHWTHSSRRRPCPVCGGYNGKCSTTQGEELATCHYQQSSRPAGGAVPGWLHILKPRIQEQATAADLRPAPRPITPPAADQGDHPASPELTHAVYSDLLGLLSLSSTDRRELTDPTGPRQFTDEELKALGVKTLTGNGEQACTRLATKYGTKILLTIPGFVQGKNKQLRLNAGDGVLIPVRNQAGQITGLRLRYHQPRPGQPKYIWLSGGEQGARVKASCAVYHPLGHRATTSAAPGLVGITEGEYKAFIAAQRLGYPVISVPGTSAWRSAGAVEIAATLGSEAVIFYDSELNPQTINQRNQLAEALTAAGLSVNIARWTPAHKGIDDLLLAQDGQTFTTYRYIPGLAGLEVNRVINERYLPDVELKTQVTVIRSPKGSGKTEMLARRLRRLADKASVLALGHRQILLLQQAERLGLEFYQDFKHGDRTDSKKLTQSNRLTITLDSLIHLDRAEAKDILIIDECEQVLRHLTAGTLKSKRREVWAKFKALCKQAKKIICLDADAGPLTYNFFSRLLGPENVELVVNTYQRRDLAPIYKADSRDEITRLLLNDLAAGIPCYVATNSKEEAQRLDRLIKNRLPHLTGLTITRDNSADPATRQIMGNLNSYVGGYDYLIASPTLGTGIDISVSHLDHTYLFGFQGSTTHADLLQHMARNRQAKKIFAYVQPGDHSEPETAEYWQSYCLEKAELTGLLLDEDHRAITGQRRAEPGELDYLQLWAEIKASEKASTNKLAANFYEQAKQEGHTIIDANQPDEARAELKEIRQARREARAELRSERNQAILEAPVITDREARALEARNYRTADATAKLERHRLETFYGQEATEELIELDSRGKLMGKLTAFMITEGMTEPADRDRAMLDDPGKLLPDHRHYTLQMTRRIQILGALGLADYSQEFTAAELISAGFTSWLDQHRAEIYRDLGLTVKANIETKPIEFIAAFFAQLGLTLTCRKTGPRGKQQRVYMVDQERLATIQQLAESRLATIQASTEGTELAAAA